MPITTRTVTISGQDKYVPFTPEELAGYQHELWFTNLTTQFSQARNEKWYPARKFFGRVAIAAANYVVKEVEIAFNNQLLYEDCATERYLQHHASCMQIEKQHLYLDGLVSSRFITDTLLPQNPSEEAITLPAYAALRVNVQTLLEGRAATLTSQILQPDHKAYTVRPTPGLVANGFYYSMENVASGQVAIRTYYFDEACVFPNTTIDSNPDNRAAPPASAADGDVAGSPGGTPPPTGTGPAPPGGGPPPPSLEEPTPGLPPQKPGQTPEEQTVPAGTYEIEYGFTVGGQREGGRSIVRGTVTSYRTRTIGGVGGREADFAFGVGTPNPGTAGLAQWNVNGFPNQIPSGFFVRVLRRVS